MPRMAEDELTDPSAWKRSRKGNLWRKWEEMTLSVFYRQDRDSYAWSIARGGDLQFSQPDFESEEEAMDALCQELLEWE